MIPPVDEFLRWAKAVGLSGFVDMALMALLIYGLLIWLKRTRRAGLILWGILVLGVVNYGAVHFELVLTSLVLRAFFAIFVIVLVVIFQEELRQIFEHIARWSLDWSPFRRRVRSAALSRPEVDVLGKTLWELAGARIGALVVLQGADPINRHVDGGVEVKGRLSEPLLKSIFDPHSVGHDGAVVIRGDVLEKLGVHLPLSKDNEKTGNLGTRHTAALGLSERTDALCLVVSEERGIVSLVQGGQIEVMRDADEVRRRVEAFYQSISPRRVESPWRTFFVRNLREKVVAVGVAAVLWLVLAYRTEVVSEYYTVTVEHAGSPAGLKAVRLTPSALEVRLSGPRRVLRSLHQSDVKLNLNLTTAVAGFQVIPVSESEFVIPLGVVLTDFRPRQVFAEIQPVTAADLE